MADALLNGTLFRVLVRSAAAYDFTFYSKYTDITHILQHVIS